MTGGSLALQALHLASAGEWQAAHERAQEGEGDAACDWVHAYLHRVEGDPTNARYWYARARRPEATGSLDEEAARIRTALEQPPPG